MSDSSIGIGGAPHREAPAQEPPAVPAGCDAPDSIRSRIVYVTEQEGLNGAAAGWRPCTGCHETSEGYSLGFPRSNVFGCEVGSGCSECGGLGVVWEYYSEADLKAMAEEAAASVSPSAESWKAKDGPLSFFTSNVDHWGAVEWFDRLAKAAHGLEKAAAAGEEMSCATHRMIMNSSALALVREHEPQVRAALASTPAPRPGGSWFAEDVRRAAERQAKIVAQSPSARVAAPQPGGAVKVKALEWNPVPWARGALAAQCSVGRYELSRTFDGLIASLHSAEMHHIGEGGEDHLKALCQADFERRVNADLLPLSEEA